MTRTISAVAVALLLSTPAFAEDTFANNGLPEEAVAIGQVNYTVSHGQLASQQVAPAAQAASVQAAPQLANLNDLLANHDALYGRQ